MASWQYKQWATLGFVRGIATPSQSGQAFCSTQWMSLLFNIIENSLPTPSGQVKLLDSSTLLQQVCKNLWNQHLKICFGVHRFKCYDYWGLFYHHGKATITLNINRNWHNAYLNYLDKFWFSQCLHFFINQVRLSVTKYHLIHNSPLNLCHSFASQEKASQSVHHTDSIVQ